MSSPSSLEYIKPKRNKHRANLSIYRVPSRLYQLSLAYFFLNPHASLQGPAEKPGGIHSCHQEAGTALEASFLFTMYYCSVSLAYELTRRETPPSAVSGVQWPRLNSHKLSWAAFAMTVSWELSESISHDPAL